MANTGNKVLTTLQNQDISRLNLFHSRIYYIQNLGNIPKRNYSLSSKLSILNKKPNNNLIQKDYILKLLKTNNKI